MRKVVFKSANTVALERYEPGVLDGNSIRIRHLYSQLSAGTELHMLTGAQGPVKDIVPGYSGVGEVIAGWEGTPFKKGDILETGEKHKDTIDLSKDWAIQTCTPVKKEFAKQATFLPLGKVALHGLHRVSFNLGDWVVVYGLGIVGNLSAQLASLNSAGRVLGIDPSIARRKAAEKVGIRTIDPLAPNYMDTVKEITGDGADIIIETSGNGKALVDSFKIAAYGGQISVVGGHFGLRELDMRTDFQSKELSIVGARRCDGAVSDVYDKWTVMKCMQEFYKLIEDRKVNIDTLISHCIKPEKATEIYTRLLNKDESVMGVVFDWTEA